MSDRDYVIMSDSTTDLTARVYEQMGVDIAYLYYSIDGKEHGGEHDDITVKEFYDMLRAGKSASTAQINVDTFTNLFEKEIAKGTDILYLCFSSGLSGTYNSACIAASDVMESNEGCKIEVVDSLSASSGEGLFLHYLVENKKKGLSLADNAKWANENKMHIVHWFTVDDLNHLYRGGRVSKTAAVVGTLLGIKPVLHVDNEGRLIPMEKVRGRAASIEALLKHMKETAIDPASQTIFISHGDSENDAKKLAEMVRAELHVKDVHIFDIGPIIGTHSGPGTVALFYYGEKR